MKRVEHTANRFISYGTNEQELKKIISDLSSVPVGMKDYVSGVLAGIALSREYDDIADKATVS